MISLSQVSKRFAGGQQALSLIDLELKKGEMAFLTGRSGAGKSTLLQIILLIQRLSGGKLLVDGRDTTTIRASEVPLYRRQIGIVFQDHRLLDDRSVFANVALPLQVSGYSHSDSQRRVRAALDKVGLLAKANYLPKELSGGEQQRVGIARAVVNRPKIILADEPTGNLDPQLSTEIMQLFEQFQQIGVTLLIASHDLSLIARLPHRVLTLDEGKLISDHPHRSRPA